MSRIWQFLLRDPVFRGFIVVFALLHLPYILPILSTEQLTRYSGRLNLIVLPAVAVAILWGTRRLRANVEIRFWRYLAHAFGVWWLAMALQIIWPEAWKLFGFSLAVDGLYALYYLIWLMAVGLNPHFPSISSFDNQIRRLRSGGTLVMILGLSVYFLLVPARLGSSSIDSWVPSLFLFVVLDILVFSRFAVLALQARNRRWKALYGLLATAHLMNSYLDLQEGLIYQGFFTWPWGPRLDFIWSLPLLVVVVAARSRHYDFVEETQGGTEERSLPDWQLGRQSPLVFFAFVLPALHILVYRLGLLNESARGPREGVVLVCLLVLFFLVLLESNLLYRGLTQAAAQRKELQELRISQEVADRSHIARQRFLANVSHEIRTPMNGILGVADMLLASSLSEQNRKRVEILRSSGRGLLQIIDDILDYTKIDVDELTVEIQRFSIGDTLNEVIGLQKRSAELKGLSLALTIDEKLPEYAVGDPNRLRQVLTNLVANSIKFTHEGSVTVKALRDSSKIRFEVRDTGIGIDPKDQERLFEPFTQVDGSRSRRYGGAGLGLAICRQIVTRLQGEIGLESRPGKGSCFWFTLPLKEARPPSRPRREPAELQWQDTPSILLAEDNPINQMVAQHQLEDLGAEVDVAENGSEVLDAMAQKQYDLILMDCQMPEMDGYETTRQIRHQEASSGNRIPIVALTAHAFGHDRERCMAAGMDDYLSKPYDRRDLANVLKRWLHPEGPSLDDSWSELSTRPRNGSAS